MKLAEALLRRKELAEKVKVVSAIKAASLFETKVVRKNVTDSVDDLTITMCKLTSAQVTAEFDFYSRQLRLIDAAIQQANWTVDVNLSGGDVTSDYVEKKLTLSDVKVTG